MIYNQVVIANHLKQLLIVSSPFLDEYTALVCPLCSDVCCRQKHGLYRENDMRYLHALDIDAPLRDATKPDWGPCECLGPQGCLQPRWLRPFKCTWYFCDQLLAALNEGPQRKARRIITSLQEMIVLYNALAESFSDKLQNHQ